MWYSKGSITPAQTDDNQGSQSSDPDTTVNISTSVSDGTNPVQGATVTLTDTTDSTKKFTGTSGSAGGCTLSNVPPGTYVVSAKCEGYNDYEGAENLTVTAETTTLSVVMEAASSSDTPGGG